MSNQKHPIKLQQEQEHIFVKKLEKHQNIVHKICTFYTNNSDDHKDLFQEITIQLWRAYPTFRGDSKFSTWMYRVALNTAITLFRKSKRNIKAQSFDKISFKIEYQDYDPTADVQIKLLYEAVRELNNIDRALVFLYLEDRTYEEIADTLGISNVNARVRMSRIKDKLKRIVNP